MDKNFNIILTGVGGQGIITLISLINEAAFLEGKDIRSSELHGLSQRGGSVEAHIRFGKKVNSPLVQAGRADLVIALEILEGLRELNKAGKHTKFLINDYHAPFIGSIEKEEIRKQLDVLQENLHIIPASQICKEKLEKEVVSTLYVLGYAVNKGLIPLKKESVLQAIKNIIPEKYQDLNIKAFNLSFNHD